MTARELGGAPAIEILTIDEAAERLKVSRRVVLRLCFLERLPGARKVGRCWRIPHTAIAAYFGTAPDEAPAPTPEPEPESEAEVCAGPRPVRRPHAARRAGSRAEFMAAIESPRRRGATPMQ